MTSKPSITDIRSLLAHFRAIAPNTSELGALFEKLMKSYLQAEPVYVGRFKKVSLWKEWEHKWGPDCGIDLVAETLDGEFTAIQCKFYEPQHQMQKKDIDSFFTESGRAFKVDGKKHTFTGKIIISTCDEWSKQAEESIGSQAIVPQRIRVQDLDRSTIDWSKFRLDKTVDLPKKEKKKLRPHQQIAIKDILEGFKKSSRGKYISACGTGKTFCALRLVEQVTKKDGVVLFLVPSISLLSQTLTEWTTESEDLFHAFAVCSDNKIGRKSEDISKHDLAIPASTDVATLMEGFSKVKSDKKMKIIFSTYQSIEVISKAQKKGLPEFDIIVCDEAHRTTGVTLAGQDESHFVKVHDQDFIKGKKRIYMTATPRIYTEAVRQRANQAGADLCSMDDPDLYGPEFHRLNFGTAVTEKLLTDYKVLVLAVDEGFVNASFQRQAADENQEIHLENVAKIIGCWNGLSKRFLGFEPDSDDPAPMRRAVAFARSIRDSQAISDEFQTVVSEFIKKNPSKEPILNCELRHVDGTFNVLERNNRLDWLKAETEENTCRILTNARCLSEGVDVPSLDAVLFLNPRDSMVDVVQSVGRIMRKAEGKKYGYVILPIAIPAGVPPEEALRDNDRYRVIWQVLEAIRAHDDRLDADINSINLNGNRSSRIHVGVIGSGGEPGEGGEGAQNPTQLPLNLGDVGQWREAIYGKIVLQCGTRPYWDIWAKDIAKIAEKHSKHIETLLESKDPKPKKTFDKFLSGIRKNINPSISGKDAIEMLSQQLITKPVFDALFDHYEFTKLNPVSSSMQEVLGLIETTSFKADSRTLERFYESVNNRLKYIKGPEARQKVIVDLYENFFKIAFPKMSARLGIVYTPIEVVDFIIHSVDEVLKTEFGQTLSDKGIHVLDPFTGTGTFIARLLQSGLIKPEDVKRKFQKELHANEIVLLAYYIATINIEETYHAINAGEYAPFVGAVLTDSFQLTESGIQGSLESALPENGARVERQRNSPIHVIMSNPPYSIGQKDEGEDNQNLDYPALDNRILETYAKESTAKLKKGLYDSYIRAIRWMTDRIAANGVMAIVTNSGFLDGNAADGIRKCLVKEFSTLYILNLRGNQRTSGEESKREGGKVFGSGSRSGIAISIMVKNPSSLAKGKILYHDVGDYLTRADKLLLLMRWKSLKDVSWNQIIPNQYGDWITTRSEEFGGYIAIGDKGGVNSIFDIYSLGVATNRDSWCLNFSRDGLINNIDSFIKHYNSEIKLAISSIQNGASYSLKNDDKKIAWTHNLKGRFKSRKALEFNKENIVQCFYRPFSKAWLYFSRDLNERVFQFPKMFPTSENENVAIVVTGTGEGKLFSAIVTNSVSELKLLYNSQCFPLYYYEKPHNEEANGLLIANDEPDKHGYTKRDAITDFALERFHKSYGDSKIKKEDIFYYVYGLLHSPTYREKYQNDLKKMLPRIPLLKDFWGYRKAGRDLAEIHLNYETIKPYKLEEELTKGAPKKEKDLYRVNEAGMKFPKVKKNEDKTNIIFNQFVTLKGIPLEAYDYIVNGKSAIEWVMERYCVTTDLNKKGEGSGIKNDPNEWSDDPRYIVDLVKRVVTVSLETNRIVASLPKFELLEEQK